MKFILSITAALAIGVALAAQPPPGSCASRSARPQWQGLHRGEERHLRAGGRRPRQQDRGRRHRAGDRKAARAEHAGRRRRRRRGAARVQRRAHAHAERRPGDGHRRSRRRRHARGGAAAHPHLRGGARRSAVDSGTRLALRAVSRQPADPRAARRRGCRSPGGDALLRRPQHLGELEGARARRDHQSDTRPAKRHHRSRSENRRADRPAQGVAGVLAGDEADPEADPRRRAARR